MPWFDAGINCFDKRMPLQPTLSAAVDSAVTKMCIIGTHEKNWKSCIDAAIQYPDNLHCTVGVHPHYADNVSAQWDSELVKRLKHQSVVAIGECGLDFNRMFSSQQNQLTVFEKQLQIAIEYQLPVYLHERDAFDHQFALLSKYAGRLKSGLVHCFTQSLEQMQAYLSLGFSIGITGWICDPKRGKSLRTAIEQLPLDKMILETDAPYLFPKNVRPRESNNQPKFLPDIAAVVAGILGISVEQLSEHTFSNACDLFGISQCGDNNV